MARRCKECRNEISSYESECFHCGSSTKRKVSIYPWLFFAMAVFIGYQAFAAADLTTAASGMQALASK